MYNFTSCKSWSPGDFNNDALKIDYGAHRGNSNNAVTFYMDYFLVEVNYTVPLYKMEIRYDWSGIPTGGSSNTLKVEGYHTASENTLVQVYDFTNTTWTTRITITKTSDDNTDQTYSLTNNEFNNGAPRIRFIGASESSDTTKDTLTLDHVRIARASTGDYALSIRHDWSGIPYGGVSQVCVEAYVANANGESMLLQVLTPPSAWNTRITVSKTSDDNSEQCYTLTDVELNFGAPSIRWIGSSDSTDSTQSDLKIDYLSVRKDATWATRSSLDSSSDRPSLMVRALSDATYWDYLGGIYWKSSTSETYHFVISIIPEFQDIATWLVGLSVIHLAGLGRRHRRVHKQEASSAGIELTEQ